MEHLRLLWLQLRAQGVHSAFSNSSISAYISQRADASSKATLPLQARASPWGEDGGEQNHP